MSRYTYTEQIAHLRVLGDNYDGIDAEDWTEAADTIEALARALQNLVETVALRDSGDVGLPEMKYAMNQATQALSRRATWAY